VTVFDIGFGCLALIAWASLYFYCRGSRARIERATGQAAPAFRFSLPSAVVVILLFGVPVIAVSTTLRAFNSSAEHANAADGLRTHLAESDSKVTQLSSDLETAQSAAAQLSRDLEKAQSTVAQLQKSSDANRGRASADIAKIRQLEEEIKARNADLEQQKNSYDRIVGEITARHRAVESEYKTTQQSLRRILAALDVSAEQDAIQRITELVAKPTDVDVLVQIQESQPLERLTFITTKTTDSPDKSNFTLRLHRGRWSTFAHLPAEAESFDFDRLVFLGDLEVSKSNSSFELPTKDAMILPDRRRTLLVPKQMSLLHPSKSSTSK
jgi:hypothetical protein